ncbi:hypothetical protein [Nonomuraea sp. SBT364]|uniref:hypothetical protein n=1 Tax=Nonomuraea sp. SBT364 TaxID=1580530 RepID=UPI00066DD0EE|nr:hypothetical protein [Nonomuraea sp. SBT364]
MAVPQRPGRGAGGAGGAALREIACDESGSEGEKLIGGNTEVFAHAGVGMSVEAAAECLRETRDRIRSPAVEYKANHLLRGKHRRVLVWLLGEVIPGQAHVYLVDKAYFAVCRLTDLLRGEITYAGTGRDERAAALHREGARALGPDGWTAFLEAFNDVMRGKADVGEFFGGVERMRPPGPLAEVMERLARARPRAEAYLARDPAAVPLLDPLIPALVRVVTYWGGAAIAHDRHNGLTEERISEVFPVPPAGFRLVEARTDPRVQVADFLAGTARKIAEEELNGRGDAELVALLRPYVDPASIWGDERSGRLLIPDGAGQVSA